MIILDFYYFILKAIRISKESLVAQHRTYNDRHFHIYWTWNDHMPKNNGFIISLNSHVLRLSA